ncbi:MAG: peptide chain release factor N(5)-glutamine methyltransferase [bacterium]|nr:peptide chain release factor N(5)-glutamine methyltransferase [bacterium]
MNIQGALNEAKNYLQHSSTPELDTELILCTVLGKDRSYLMTHPEQELSPAQRHEFEDLVYQRLQGKPIAYITHEKEFFGRSFYVDERCLIPRPETEEMVEDALNFLKKHPEHKTIIDLGTGSGNIAITMALELTDREVYGLEISKDALEVAIRNHQKHPCNNVTFLESDLLSALPLTLHSQPLTILANLPYIGIDTNNFISDETKAFEPDLALFGGSDGLELYRRTWQQIKDRNLNLATLFMEIGFSQTEDMERECQKAFLEMKLEIKSDLAGLPRTAILTKQSL